MTKVTIYKVGGAVRDKLLNLAVADVDWVVVGADAGYMLEQGYQPVGADFPVFLHPKTGEEYALARTERKSGRGYGGFNFYATPEVTLEEDLARRDLTINAIAEDEHGNLYDPYNGQQDLQNKLLRHVSPSFIEDPLRVLRVARFAARYANLGFEVADETMQLMEALSTSGELQDLTAERVWKELSRALMEPRPEIFLQVLYQCKALQVLLPELIDGLALIKQVLQQATKHQQPLAVRWACLMVPLVNEPDVKVIKVINERFKVPNECADLALLTGQYLNNCQNSLSLTADELLKLLQRVDILRRPERFIRLLQVTTMVAIATQQTDSFEHYLPVAFLTKAATAVQLVAVEPFIANGLKGAQLGEALTKERLQRITAVIASYQP